jgi:Uncharacterized protein conserved in bacteria
LTYEIYPDNILSQNFRSISSNPASDIPCIAFEGDRCIATGELRDVARAAKQTLDRRKDASVLVFDGMTGGPIDLDFRGTVDDVLARLPDMAPPAPQKTPRPPRRAVRAVRNWAWSRAKSRLLPRHWEWLAQQSGGASVALRRLVEEARRANRDKDRVRHAQEAAYRFIAAMAGNKPHYEEVARALFAGDAERFEAWTASGRPTCAITRAGWPLTRSSLRVRARARPVDPADRDR